MCLAFYGGDVMDKEIKCPLCGAVEISKKKRVLGQRTGSMFYLSIMNADQGISSITPIQTILHIH